jgi:hypothetical protein
MKTNKERGYVLISVLAIIIIVMSFSLLLIPKTLNTSVQVNKSELNTQAKDLSEMGIHYAHAYLQDQVIRAVNYTKANETDYYKWDQVFCERIKSQFSTFNTNFLRSIPMDTSANSKYRFQINNNELISFNPNTITMSNTTCTGLKSITIPIKSVGIVDGKPSKEVKANFIIENNSGASGSPGGTGTGTGNLITNPNLLGLTTVDGLIPIEIKGNNISSLFSSAKFTRTVLITGNGVLKVGGHAWFDASPSIDFRGNNGKVYVTGDAYFRNKVSLGGNGTNYICVKGSVFLFENGAYQRKNSISDISATNNVDPCPSQANPEREYYYDINGWGIIESNLNVIY